MTCSNVQKGKTCLQRGRYLDKRDWCRTCLWDNYHDGRRGHTAYQDYPTREETEREKRDRGR